MSVQEFPEFYSNCIEISNKIDVYCLVGNNNPVILDGYLLLLEALEMFLQRSDVYIT
jgi:hypothetical protein